MKGLLKYFIILVFVWKTNVLYVLVYCWVVSSYLLLTCCKVSRSLLQCFVILFFVFKSTTHYPLYSYQLSLKRCEISVRAFVTPLAQGLI